MDGLRLPIDPRTVEKSLVSRKLRSVEQDGSLTYDDPESSCTALSDRLGRVWDEYPNGLLDLTEGKLATLEPGAAAIDVKEEQEEEEDIQERSEIMTYQDMQKLRSSLFDQLNTARNELWFALELAKTLGVSSGFTIDPPAQPGHPYHKKHKVHSNTSSITDSNVEPPVLPAGSYTATPSINPLKSQQAQITDMELALATKHQALDECTSLVDSAVEELEIMSEAGDRFWKDLRQFKSGQGGRGRWAVVPRPDFTRSMGAGDKAKDVVIPYALDEAPVALRARCLAAFDLDPTKVDPLTFGARTHRRLRVSIATDTLMSTSTTITAEESSIEAMMDEAQLESIDEELYGEITNEMSRNANGEVTPTAARFKMGSRDVIFEMYDTLNPPPTSLPTSPLCDLIASAARLSLLQAYRRRKARLIGQTAPGISILQPIVQLLQLQQTSEVVQAVLASFARLIDQTQVRGSLDTLHSVADREGANSIERLLTGEAGTGDMGVLYTLDIEGCRGITVELTVPVSCRITTSRASFTVQDTDALSSIVADDVSNQLLGYTETLLKQELDDGKTSGMLIDELENVIRIPPDSVLEVSIPAPFDRISASVTGSISARYDHRGNQGYPDWIREVAASIRISDT